MPDTARRVRVTGRVQAVFFRAWTQTQARELGIHGWVRNAADGSVEAQLEGAAEALNELIRRLHEGPPSAEVADVRVEEIEPEGWRRFDVRH